MVNLIKLQSQIRFAGDGKHDQSTIFDQVYSEW